MILVFLHLPSSYVAARCNRLLLSQSLTRSENPNLSTRNRSFFSTPHPNPFPTPTARTYKKRAIAPRAPHTDESVQARTYENKNNKEADAENAPKEALPRRNKSTPRCCVARPFAFYHSLSHFPSAGAVLSHFADP